MRVLIVDDEPLARSVIRSLLKDDPEITLIEECSGGRPALQRLLKGSFDLLFLDVQMPDLDGFGVLKESAPDKIPIVVFVTAFEQHAVRAFSFAAADYLIKPFDDRRFATSLQRAKQRVRERVLASRSRELIDLLEQAAGQQTSGTGKISVLTGGSVLRVDLASVLWVEAQDKHVLFHTDSGEIRARQPLSELEQQLDPQAFLRVHRSCIVALARIGSLEKTEGGAAFVVLDDGSRVVVSRARVADVRARLRGNSR